MHPGFLIAIGLAWAVGTTLLFLFVRWRLYAGKRELNHPILLAVVAFWLIVSGSVVLWFIAWFLSLIHILPPYFRL
jgi:hypothetical protein